MGRSKGDEYHIRIEIWRDLNRVARLVKLSNQLGYIDQDGKLHLINHDYHYGLEYCEMVEIKGYYEKSYQPPQLSDN